MLVSVDKKFLLRTNSGDHSVAEAELREWVQTGQCRAADFLYDFVARKWSRVGEHVTMASLFAEKPAGVPDRRVIYFLAPGGAPAAPLGPFSTKEIQARAQAHEISANTWVFVEGDKEWRQVRNVKILNEMLPALPTDQPAEPSPEAAPLAPPPFSLTPAPGASATPSVEPPTLDSGSVSLPPPEPAREMTTNPSIKLDLGGGMPAADAPPAPPAVALTGNLHDDPAVEREESTLAIDTMGLNLHSDNFDLSPSPSPAAVPSAAPVKPANIPPLSGVASAPPPAPPKAPVAVALAADFSLDLGRGSPPSSPPTAGPPKAKPTLPPSAPPGGGVANDDHFDGIVAEIPMDPVWLVKQGTSEAVSGPFRFLEVIKFLEEGRLNKNDKIARTGNKAFTKIGQQYEFNVKFSIENVMEGGQEKQKILIRRRHPRVPYITGVQIVSKQGLLVGQCVNISAGGILMEAPKAEFNLGEIIEVKILPGLIAKAISCKSLIIGKIPKIPPGYALKFEDLKPEDKEAIEHYVQETLKREMQKKN